MLACTGNHEIEAQSDGNNTVFKSVQTRWKVGPALLCAMTELLQAIKCCGCIAVGAARIS